MPSIVYEHGRIIKKNWIEFCQIVPKYNTFFKTLQYCIGFAIYQHESTTGIRMFPILNLPPSSYHPSGLSQCTSPKHQVSCIEPGLATHFIYDIIHVSMPFSQIIPPSPSPPECKRLFYTSVSLLLSCIQGYCYHLSKFHCWAYTPRKPELKETHVPQCSSQHCL